MDAFKTAGQAPLAGKQQLSGFSEEHLAMSTEPTEFNARPTDAADAKEVGPAEIDEAKSVAGRRRFLRWFGVSASGVALANTIDTSKEKIEAGESALRKKSRGSKRRIRNSTIGRVLSSSWF